MSASRSISTIHRDFDTGVIHTASSASGLHLSTNNDFFNDDPGNDFNIITGDHDPGTYSLGFGDE
jgi:hypothetical protein